jgi:3-oxoacyl-[acyl-carrier protein] reductase
MKHKIGTALVTGSTRGIGLEIAKGLSSCYSHIGINGRDYKTVTEIVKVDSSFFAAAGDLNSTEELRSIHSDIKSKYGKIDLLICNAGGGSPNNELTYYQEWERVFQLNLFSAVNAASVFVDLITPATGKIIFISSIASNGLTNAPAAYAASKAALNTYVKILARELAPKGICVNALLLGNIMFEGSVWDRNMERDLDGTLKYVKTNVPLNMFGSTDEIAEWCIFLASNKVRFATGSLFTIDGGQTS